MLYRYKGWCIHPAAWSLSLRFLLMEFEEYWSDDIIAKTHRGFSYPCLLQVLPSGSGSGAESFQALKNMSSAYQYVIDIVRQAATVSLTIYCKVYTPVVAKTKPKLRKVSSDPDLSQSPPSNGQEGKKFNTNLFEESPFDAGLAKAKPKLRKVSSDPDLTQSPPSAGREGKKFNTNLFEESPFDDAGLAKTKPKLRKVSSDPDLSQSPPSAGREGKKFNTNLFEESPFDAGLAKTKPKLRKVSSDPDLSQTPPSAGREGKKFDTNLLEESPFDAGLALETLKGDLETLKGILNAARQGIFDAGETIKGMLDAAGQGTENFDPNLFEASPSDGQEKKFDPVLFEVSPFDGGQETKNFDPNLFEVSPFDGGQETKNFDPNLFKVLPSDGQAEEAIKGILDAARQGIFDAQETIKGLLDAARQEMKNFDPNLFEVSPSDGQEMKNFEPNLSESSSSDGQEKEFVPDFFEVISCDGEEMQNSHFRELELSIAKELSDSWFVPVDDRQVSLIVAEKEKMSDDNSSRKKEIMSGANSSEEALLDKYLERLEAEDAATYKEEEMKCNPKLFEVSADGFESLSPLEKRHWIVLQFIRERYDPPIRSETRGPLLEVSDLEDSDQEESVGQQDVALGYGKDEQESEIEDCILDLSSLFPSDD